MGHWRTIWNNALLDFPKLEKTFEVSTPMRFWPWRIGAAHREFTYTKDLDLQRNGGIHLKCSRWRWHMNKLKKLQNTLWNNNRWTHADLQYVHTNLLFHNVWCLFFSPKNGCERIYNLERVCAKWTVPEGHREDDGNHSRRIITHILRMSLLLLCLVSQEMMLLSCYFQKLMESIRKSLCPSYQRALQPFPFRIFVIPMAPCEPPAEATSCRICRCCFPDSFMSQGRYFCTIDPDSDSLDAQFTEPKWRRLIVGERCV